MANTFEEELALEEELPEAGGAGEAEGILGAIGNVLGGLLGEEELPEEELPEAVHELPEAVHEEELPEIGGAGEAEGILGAIGNVLGGLLGEEEVHEEELPEVHELVHELHELPEIHELGEEEAPEQFFKRLARGVGSFVKRAAPILKRVAKVAAPMVGTAIGGPFGAILGKLASSALGEEELHELHEVHELHELYEAAGEEEAEGEEEVAQEIAYHEQTHHEALAEMMAEAAAQEQHEGQAEAMAGASVVTVISPADRRALRRILPHLVRGVAILTRILRRRRITRPAVRAVPTIVRRTIQSVKRQAAAGAPITRKTVARAAATQVRRVLGNPKACAVAITRNIRASRALKRPRRRAISG